MLVHNEEIQILFAYDVLCHNPFYLIKDACKYFPWNLVE